MRDHRVVARARIAEIAIGDARPAQKEHLKEPIQDDRELAEEEGAEEIRRDQDVVEHQKRHRQHGDGTKDVEEIGKRGEPPLSLVELEQLIDDPGIDQETGQHDQKPVKPLHQAGRLEAQVETRDDRRRRGHEIVHHDEELA